MDGLAPKKSVLDKDKLDAAVHYVIARIERPSELGDAKLHKILWFADLELTYAHDVALAGGIFVRTPQGPWGSSVDKSLKRLEKNRLIAEIQSSYYGHRQRQFTSLRLPKLAPLSAIEVDVLNRMIDSVCFNHRARSVSEAAHGAVWERTRDGDAMSASCVFEHMTAAPTAEDLAWARAQLTPETEAELAKLGLV